MQSMRRALNAYGQGADTLPPLQQVVLLYDGAIRRLRETRSAIEGNRVRERCTAVGKAMAIVDGLQSCLDHGQGGEIALHLDRIYTYIGFRIGVLNLEPEVAICDELIMRLSELRTSWATLLNQQSMPAAPGPAAPGDARPASMAFANGVLVTT